MSTSRGTCYIVSAPSGSGKTTLLHRVSEEIPDIVIVTSVTTRQPRTGEASGVDYHFVDEAEFKKRIAADAFVEYEEVHGAMYGTPRDEFDSALAAGKKVILEIDVKGAEKVLDRYPHAVPIYILPSSPAQLRARLERRGKDSAEAIANRLTNAAMELNASEFYHYLVINDDIDEATKEMTAIMVAEGIRIGYRQPIIDTWLEAAKSGL